MRILGTIVLVLGIIMTAITGFTIITHEEVVDLGAIEISKEKETPIYWSPITGGVLIVAGAIIIFAGAKRKTSEMD